MLKGLIGYGKRVRLDWQKTVTPVEYFLKIGRYEFTFEPDKFNYYFGIRDTNPETLIHEPIG